MELLRYVRIDGEEPLTEWLDGFRDRATEARIRLRLRRLEAGSFGDCEPVGEGVLELRLHFGAGHRVYLGRQGQTVVVLLCGGDKATQASDIARTTVYWADWKARR